MVIPTSLPNPSDSLPSLKPGSRIVMPRMAAVLRCDVARSGSIFEFYVNASYAAELFFDDKNRFVFIHALALEHRHQLPPGKPSWRISRVPAAMNPAYMIGETMLVKCTWPADSELSS